VKVRVGVTDGVNIAVGEKVGKGVKDGVSEGVKEVIAEGRREGDSMILIVGEGIIFKPPRFHCTIIIQAARQNRTARPSPRQTNKYVFGSQGPFKLVPESGSLPFIITTEAISS
jgi:hypothetical protein